MIELENQKKLKLFFQFDNDPPIEGMSTIGDRLIITMFPSETSFIKFSDGTKEFQLILKEEE
jgi:hypothetical protein